MNVQRFGAGSAQAAQVEKKANPAEQRQARIAEEKLTQQNYKTTARGGARTDLMDKIRNTTAGNKSKIVMDFSKGSGRGVSRNGVDSKV